MPPILPASLSLVCVHHASSTPAFRVLISVSFHRCISHRFDLYRRWHPINYQENYSSIHPIFTLDRENFTHPPRKLHALRPSLRASPPTSQEPLQTLKREPTSDYQNARREFCSIYRRYLPPLCIYGVGGLPTVAASMIHQVLQLALQKLQGRIYPQLRMGWKHIIIVLADNAWNETVS